MTCITKADDDGYTCGGTYADSKFAAANFAGAFNCAYRWLFEEVGMLLSNHFEITLGKRLSYIETDFGT
jgi:hypothetical protein